MTCAEIESLLDVYAAGRLDDERAQAVESHLAACDSCAETADVQWIAKFAGVEHGPPPSRALRDEILASVVNQPQGMPDECYLVTPILSARMDGETDAAERALMDRHLAACTSCRHALSLLQRTERAVISLPAAEPSPRLWKRIEGLIPTPKRSIFEWLTRPLLRPAFGAAGLAAAAVLVFCIVLPHLHAPGGSPTGPPGTELAGGDTVVPPAVTVPPNDNMPGDVVDSLGPGDPDAVTDPAPLPEPPRVVSVGHRVRPPYRSTIAPAIDVPSDPASPEDEGAGGPDETAPGDGVRPALLVFDDATAGTEIHLAMASRPERRGYEPPIWQPSLSVGEGAEETVAPARAPIESAVGEVEADLVVDAHDDLWSTLPTDGMGAALFTPY